MHKSPFHQPEKKTQIIFYLFNYFITKTRSSEFKFDLQQRTSSIIAKVRFKPHLSLSKISVGIKFGIK